MMFKILLGIDILTVLIVGVLFVVGLGDGSVSAFNAQLWVGIWCALAAILAGGVALHRNARPALANLVLALLAVPAVLSGLFIAIFALSGAKFI